MSDALKKRLRVMDKNSQGHRERKVQFPGGQPWGDGLFIDF